MADTPDTGTPDSGTPDSGTPADQPAKGRRKPGLEGMLLPELKQLAAGLGLKTSGMRKGALVEAIKAAQSGGGTGGGAPAAQRRGAGSAGQAPSKAAAEKVPEKAPDKAPEKGGETAVAKAADEPARQSERAGGQQTDQRQGGQDRRRDQQDDRQGQRSQDDRQRDRQPENKQDKQPENKQPERQPENKQDKQPEKQQDRRQQDQQDDDEGGSRRNRRRRGRDRNNQQGQGGNQGGSQSGSQAGNQTGSQGGSQGGSRRGEPDLQILEDDVLAPCAGILDLMDNYAFVRTSGYLAGADDVYVSMSMVRRHGLRRGDAIVGQVRQPREGERREKFNPLVRIDSVNGADPETARHRTDFERLTPLHPSERLRLETAAAEPLGRAVDLLAPVGKGQRGLLVSPPRVGRTQVLHTVAAALTANHPECHLMVVLLDERPEEVTDFQRSIKGEVITSSFDRPPSDHTVLAELAIERAKRLVELGHDVVVLLDGLTRLGRAYNQTATQGRALDGGVDVGAVHPTKRFFGAARNIENGGSLTILATVAVGTASRTDELLYEELEGTSNLELRLVRDLAGERGVPAVDVTQSGTRHEDLLLGPDEVAGGRELRRSLAGLDPREGRQWLADRLAQTSSNRELLQRARQGALARS